MSADDPIEFPQPASAPTRVQKLELALRDALDLAARAVEDLDDANRNGDWTKEVAQYTAKLGELQKVLEEK